jgi:hypothetical protein
MANDTQPAATGAPRFEVEVETRRAALEPLLPPALAEASAAALHERVLHAEDPLVASAAAGELLKRVDYPAATQPIPLADALTNPQRELCGLLARREGLRLPTFAIPAARLTRARWLSLEPPGPLEQPVPAATLGKEGSLPFWAARHALGKLQKFAEQRELLPPRARLEAFSEILLHAGYRDLAPAWQEVAPLVSALGPELGAWSAALLARVEALYARTDVDAPPERAFAQQVTAQLSCCLLVPPALLGQRLGQREARQFVLFDSDDGTLLPLVVGALDEALRVETLLRAYEGRPTLTALSFARKFLPLVPDPRLIERVNRDLHDPSFKKSLPKPVFDRTKAQFEAFVAEHADFGSLLVKPTAKKTAAKGPAKPKRP